MTILEMIAFLIEVEENTGIKPTTVFVGYEEHERLKTHVKDMIPSEQDSMDGSRVNKFWGCKVKYVPIKSYIAAGWSHDEFRSCIKKARSNSA